MKHERKRLWIESRKIGFFILWPSDLEKEIFDRNILMEKFGFSDKI